ncbi:hypothetical protein [uncultured Desulfuromonas sp.]|uniref:hypothetical protein n=1 Tax=uncultured Desulfuromonas sp. TaxID=181013 RepID=UPI002AAC1FA2|nr:hypothetical protein [uncultured Desulfuromonas sp.]
MKILVADSSTTGTPRKIARAIADARHAVDSLDNAVLIDRFICQGAIATKLIDGMKTLPPECRSSTQRSCASVLRTHVIPEKKVPVVSPVTSLANHSS